MRVVYKRGFETSKKRNTYFRNFSRLQRKEYILRRYHGKIRIKKLKAYYKRQPEYRYRWKWVLFVRHLADLKIKPMWLDFLRWIFIDALRGRKRKNFGIYQFVAMPGQGKTMSMVAHMERYRAAMDAAKVPYVICTNFFYKYQDYHIGHWSDMVRISKECYKNHVRCLIAIDEVHITFDSADWKNFPAEILAMLSFNRKYNLQFLCSSQMYERIPKKIRDISNFTIICKNVGNFDRLFRCYYFEKSDYEASFDGKRKRAKMIKEFVVSDDFYKLYDTFEQIELMTKTANAEKDLRQQAFDVLFGDALQQAEADADCGATAAASALPHGKLRNGVKRAFQA